MIKKQVPAEVLDILKRSTINECSLLLPPVQLDRALYTAVNKVLTDAGGKWNTKKRAHIFNSDPRPLLGLVLETGQSQNQQQKFQSFYTPVKLVQQMIGLADLRKGQRILEPSAGTGRIIDGIGMELDWNFTLLAIEFNVSLSEGLRVKYKDPVEVRCADFMDCFDQGGFDRILMNPPFTNGQDIKHIKHAMAMLKDGGRLVAICANGPRQERELKPLASEWIDLEPGAFKESGTNVNAAMLVINKAEIFRLES